MNINYREKNLRKKHTAGTVAAKTGEIIGIIVGQQSIPALSTPFLAFSTIIGRIPSQLKPFLQHLAERSAEIVVILFQGVIQHWHHHGPQAPSHEVGILRGL